VAAGCPGFLAIDEVKVGVPRMAALNGHFELVVETAGLLCLPGEVLEGLGATPGDFLVLEVGPFISYLVLEIYGELLADNWEALSPENRWLYLRQILSRPLTAVTPEGIPIPFGVFPLARGERVFLHVLRFGTHRLFLFKDGSG
jgi:hypothetical protein